MRASVRALQILAQPHTPGLNLVCGLLHHVCRLPSGGPIGRCTERQAWRLLSAWALSRRGGRGWPGGAVATPRRTPATLLAPPGLTTAIHATTRATRNLFCTATAMPDTFVCAHPGTASGVEFFYCHWVEPGGADIFLWVKWSGAERRGVQYHWREFENATEQQIITGNLV